MLDSILNFEVIIIISVYPQLVIAQMSYSSAVRLNFL